VIDTPTPRPAIAHFARISACGSSTPTNPGNAVARVFRHVKRTGKPVGQRFQLLGRDLIGRGAIENDRTPRPGRAGVLSR